MDLFGIQRLAKDVVAKAKEKKLSEKSVLKMEKWSAPKYLPRLIVSAGSISDRGRLFCTSTYAAEGNDALVFGFYRIDEDLERHVNSPLIFPEGGRTRKRCREAAAQVEPIWRRAKRFLAMAAEQVRLIEEEVSILEEDIQLFDAEQAATDGSWKKRLHSKAQAC